MKYKLVKLDRLSGKFSSVYSVHFNDKNKTLFHQFLEENSTSFKDEIADILKRLNTIGKKTGARESFFKLKEGKPGDGVCALYDNPDKNLRLYCIRYADSIIILGGGGPKNVRALQDDEKLKNENYFLRQLSGQISNRLKEKDITYSDDYLEFLGDLEFDDYEDQ